VLGNREAVEKPSKFGKTYKMKNTQLKLQRHFVKLVGWDRWLLCVAGREVLQCGMVLWCSVVWCCDGVVWYRGGVCGVV